MNKEDEKQVLDDITERIFSFIDAQALSYAEFAESIDIGASQVSHMKNGRNKVSLNICAKIVAAFPNINPDWLLSGNGTMYRGETSSPTSLNLFSEQNQPPEHTPSTTSQLEVAEKIAESTKAIGRKVQKIVLFYDDNSYQEFMP